MQNSKNQDHLKDGKGENIWLVVTGCLVAGVVFKLFMAGVIIFK